MALVTTGTKTRSAGIFSAIKKHSEFINLKPAKRILIRFDPFADNSKTLRQFTYVMSRRKIIETNTDCRIRTEILSDNSEPLVEVFLENNEKLLMKCGLLNVVEMIQIFNKYVSALVPKEEPAQNLSTVKSVKKHTN